VIISLTGTAGYCGTRDPGYFTPDVPVKPGNCTQVYYISKSSRSLPSGTTAAPQREILSTLHSTPPVGASSTPTTLSCDVGKLPDTNMTYKVDGRFEPKHFR
jgi:hypothetical protein